MRSDGLNALFGFETEALDGCDEGGDDPCELTAAAADTEFADGPATLLGVNATGAIITSTLPAGSTVIYEGVEDDDEGGDDVVAPAALVDVAGVAVVPFGDGAIVTLGWDWFPDTECCEETARSRPPPSRTRRTGRWCSTWRSPSPRSR